MSLRVKKLTKRCLEDAD